MSVLARLGISRDEIRRAAANQVSKARSGRKGLPQYVVSAMYADYQRTQSLSKTAALYGRTRQSMWQIFHAHGLPMNQRNFQPRVIFDGREFAATPGKNYFREIGTRKLLHREMWKKFRGEIPAGHQVSFKDGDFSNLRLSNLICAPIAEISLLHYRRRYPSRAELTAEQRRKMWRTHNRLYMRRKAAAFKKRGLRTDGKPLARKNPKRRVMGGNAAWRSLSDHEPALTGLLRSQAA